MIRKDKIKIIKEFRLELKKSVSTAVIAAFSFLIALSWRDVITSWVTKITKTTLIRGNFISAIIITVISVIGIFIVTKIFSIKKDI